MCQTCNKIYDTDKTYNTSRIVPYLRYKHFNCSYVVVSEHDIESDHNYYDDKEKPETVSVEYSDNYNDAIRCCRISFKLIDPDWVYCFEEPFLSEFKEWQETQERIEKRKAENRCKWEEKIKNGIPLIPPDWWKDDDEKAGG